MRNKGKTAALILSLLMVLGNAGCGDAGMNEMENGVYKSRAEIYFSFASTDMLKEEISGNEYLLHYVFSEAKYKSPQNAANPDGVRGRSALFDGYSTYSDTCQTREYESMTVSVWVAPRAFDTRTDGKPIGILSCFDESGGFELGIYNYGTWGFKAATDMGTVRIRCEEAPVDLYRWNYLTVVFDGKNHKISLYKNGERVAESSSPGGKIFASEKELRVGGIYDGAVAEETFECSIFSGLMDELEIYGSALSERQIAEKFASLQDECELDVYEDLWLDPDVLADDRYAPQYHLRTAQNWQNETYGFFYYNGYYHAFCQQNVLAPYYTDGQRWGHFISKDLVTWEELVPALVPEQNGIDDNHVFSGGAALDADGNPVLFYTGVNFDNAYLNLISSARPADLSDKTLEKWTKSGKIVVEQGEISTRDSFRDPFIYKENGEYFMLIGGTDRESGNGAVYCYKATDGTLEHWEYLSCLYSGNRNKYPYMGTCYELPNLFRLENEDKTLSKYMLMLSPIGGTVNGVYYLLGDFDAATGTFIPEREEPYRYDLGPVSQVLCPSGFYDERTDRNLFLTMSRTGMTAQERMDSGWTNVMTLFKEIYLDDEGGVCFAPIEEYQLLYDECLIDTAGEYAVDEANDLLSEVEGDQLKICVEIDPAEDSEAGLYVKCELGGGEYVEISYDRTEEYFYTSAARSSTAMRNNGAGGGNVSVEGDLVFTVYVDRAMVETYLNGKNQSTVFGYNRSPTANGIKVFSSGETAKIRKITVYRMNSARGETVPAYWG